MIEDYDFYGAMIREARLGPRHELVLSVEIWPKGQPFFGGGTIMTIHFSAIANYAAVKRFFAAVPGDSLHYLRYAIKPSPGRHIVEMEFDRTEDRITITAGKINLSRGAHGPPAAGPKAEPIC